MSLVRTTQERSPPGELPLCLSILFLKLRVGSVGRTCPPRAPSLTARPRGVLGPAVLQRRAVSAAGHVDSQEGQGDCTCLLLVVKGAEPAVLGTSAGVQHTARVATIWASHITRGTWAQGSPMTTLTFLFAVP